MHIIDPWPDGDPHDPGPDTPARPVAAEDVRIGDVLLNATLERHEVTGVVGRRDGLIVLSTGRDHVAVYQGGTYAVVDTDLEPVLAQENWPPDLPDRHHTGMS